MNRLLRNISFVVGVLTMPLISCGSGGVDPNAANANAGCESATADLLTETATMLPGRACQNCHKDGGQAPAADVRWTVSGTVYSSATAACNSGGVAGATVEILTASGSVQATLTTNAAGNFYTTQAVTFPLRARVKKGAMTAEMSTPQANGNCASCHAKPGVSGAPGRLYLQ